MSKDLSTTPLSLPRSLRQRIARASVIALAIGGVSVFTSQAANAQSSSSSSSSGSSSSSSSGSSSSSESVRSQSVNGVTTVCRTTTVNGVTTKSVTVNGVEVGGECPIPAFVFPTIPRPPRVNYTPPVVVIDFFDDDFDFSFD